MFRLTLLTTVLASLCLAVIAPAAADGHLMITSPGLGEIVHADTLDLTAVYDVEDLPTDVYWAVRDATCERDDAANMAGNVGGFSDDFTWENGLFAATVDVTSWGPGAYCFIFNPAPPNDADRVTQMFYLVDDYVEFGGTLYMGEDGRGNSPTHAIGGLVGDAGGAGVVGAVSVNYRELGETVVYLPTSLTFSAAGGVGGFDADAKAVMTTTSGAEIQVLDRDATDTYERGAVIVRSAGAPSVNDYEIDATPGDTGADSWVPFDRGNAHVHAQP